MKKIRKKIKKRFVIKNKQKSKSPGFRVRNRYRISSPCNRSDKSIKVYDSGISDFQRQDSPPNSKVFYLPKSKNWKQVDGGTPSTRYDGFSDSSLNAPKSQEMSPIIVRRKIGHQ